MDKLEIVSQRVAEMKQIAQKLKSNFFSIDKQIEQVTEACIPFFATPEMLTRPLVVCLWGPTGVGKTDLVRNLIEEMGMGDSYAHFDMGEYASGYGEWSLRYSLESLANTVENGRAVIVFDEMQTVRCIDERGLEVDRPATRLLWEVLDSGTITKREHFSNYPLELAHELERCLKVGVRAVHNRVTDRADEYRRIIEGNYAWLDGAPEICLSGDDGMEEERPAEEPKTAEITCLTRRHFERLYQSNPAFFEGDERWDRWGKELFEKAVDLEALIEIVRSVSRGVKLGEPKSLRNSLVFCLGNLDEVFTDAHNTNPDEDIELLRARTEKVTLAQVKDALMVRFRAEQIARFGNNHVVYPSLDRAGYEQIIQKMLSHTASRAEENFGIQLDIEDSVRELIFRESVFPTQGARSVGTSFSALADTYLSHAIYGMDWDASKSLVWSYDRDSQEYVFQAPGQPALRLPIQLRVDIHRQSDLSEYQAVVGVHEAGHAVVYMCEMGKIPREVRSRTASEEGGFMLANPLEFETLRTHEAYVSVALGGFVAEKMVFGLENVSSGSAADYSAATARIQSMYRSMGVYQEQFTGCVGHICLDSQWALQETDQLTQQKLREILAKVESLLERHRPLLAELGSYLAENSVIKEDMLLEMANRHGLHAGPEFSHRSALRDFLSNHKAG